MEELVNCHIYIDIWKVENISGGDRTYEIVFLTPQKNKYKLIFDNVWDIRCSIENACIDRFAKFKRKVDKRSSIVLVQNSDYIKYIENEVSGTYPTDALHDYILFDEIDTVVEVITTKEPVLVEIP